MTDYALVLFRRHAGREWSLDGNNYDSLTILDGGDKPSKESLDEMWESVKEENEAEEQTAIAAKESAKAKLAALGLTEAEVNAIIGGV